MTPDYGRQPVGGSADLNRVIAIPRRDLETSYSPGELRRLEESLRRTDVKCVCASQGRKCPTSLKPIQAFALMEAKRAGGLFAPIGVGHGKTLIDLLLPMVLPGCKVAVLLIPANLKAQMLERDVPYYRGHWRLPNIAGGQWFTAGLPVVHVLTYNKLSSQDASDLLKRLNPDTIIADEAHSLKDRKAARTIRFLRHFSEREGTRFCPLSGTMASRSIRDAAHLSALALGEASPFPREWKSTDDWASAIDPCTCAAATNPDADCSCRAHPGALMRLCEGKENVREGFRRRRNDTLGVVYTSESALKQTLIIRKREPGPVPPELMEHIKRAHSGTRPDEERFQEQLQAAACARQLASGFFHRWRYPRGESPELVAKWFAYRKAFNSEVWDQLKKPEVNLDSPGLLKKAADRWHRGYTVYSGHTHTEKCYESADCDEECDGNCDHEQELICTLTEHGEKRVYPPHCFTGPLPVWESVNWPAWRDIQAEVRPVAEPVWISDFVVDEAAAWAKKNVGIVWVEFPALGRRIAQKAGIPFFGGGPAASATIPHENGKRSIVASIKAHGTGKNLQVFSRNLVVTPPADGATWEQLIARTHRPGQEADEVEVEVMQHVDDLRAAFAKAQELARFIEETDGQAQKLLLANYVW